MNFSEIITFVGEDVIKNVFSSQFKYIRFISSRQESMNLLITFFQKVINIHAKNILDGGQKIDASKLVKQLDNVTFNVSFESSSKKNYACDLDLSRY